MWVNQLADNNWKNSKIHDCKEDEWVKKLRNKSVVHSVVDLDGFIKHPEIYYNGEAELVLHLPA